MLKAMYGRDSLTEVKLPSTLTTIGSGSFRDCGLTSITIPEGVTTIGMSVFSESNLVEVRLPKSLTFIDEYAFDCDYLSQVIYAGTPEQWEKVQIEPVNNGSIKKAYVVYDADIPDGLEFKLNSNGNSYTITGYTGQGSELVLPQKIGLFPITAIGNGAFSGNSTLQKIKIPDSVTIIPNGTFCDCKNLSIVILPNTITAIEDNAFSGCNSLDRILIHENAIQLGENLFDKNTIVLVYENSAIHKYCVINSQPHFVINKTDNPYIAYGINIMGNVKYSDGFPVSNATVTLINEHDGVVKESVTTDENGNYSFTYAEVGRYTIRATDDSGNTASEVVSVKRMNVFDVFLAGETDLVLKKGYTVSGTVSPASATVTLTDADGNVIDIVETTDGTFKFTDVPNGSYILKAETENGTFVKEITVFNGDITGESLVVETATSATITGYVEVEDREFSRHKRNWVEVTLYNSEGVAVDTQKTDADGKYAFTNLPLGEYSIVAETHEMRPDKHKHFERSHKLTGYAYVDVTEAKIYDNVNIVLYEENDHLATISGKVTAQGESQDCQVILANVFKHEVASYETQKNGKYTFKNIPDGLYFITAITNNKGMGFTVVVVHNGVVYGETDIFVLKSDRVHSYEEKMWDEIPDCNSHEDALKHKDKIIEHKRFYDALPHKEKKQFSKDYIDRLNKLAELVANASYDAPDGFEMERGGTIISGDELDAEDTIEFVLNVSELEEHEIPDDGIKTEDDFKQQSIKDTAKDKHIAKYYDISLTKNGKQIGNVHKHTDTTGKLRITMEIPEEHRGHKHYTFVHMHNGEPTTLVDLDNDPNTVTFEIDKFSTFALTYSDVELTGVTETPTASIAYDEATGEISVTSTGNVFLYIATYTGNQLSGCEAYEISAGTSDGYLFSANQKAFVWDQNLNPLCAEFTINN